MMRSFLLFVGVATALVLALGFGGRFHGAGDTFALARPVLVPVLAVVSISALVRGPRLFGSIGLTLAIGAGLSVARPMPMAVPNDVRAYAVYQKNLLFRLPDVRPVAEDILASGADFVTLQELHERNRPILEMIGRTYPYAHFCPFAAVGGIAVLSRWPPVEGQSLCEDYGGLAAMQVATPDGPLWVVSIHLHWPWPFRQASHVEELLPLLARLDGPTLIGGDFNMMAWGHSVRAIAKRTATAYAGYPGTTFAFDFGTGWDAILPELPIDHVLLPNGGSRAQITRQPRFGSDHYGILARFAW